MTWQGNSVGVCLPELSQLCRSALYLEHFKLLYLALLTIPAGLNKPGSVNLSVAVTKFTSKSPSGQNRSLSMV